MERVQSGNECRKGEAGPQCDHIRSSLMLQAHVAGSGVFLNKLVAMLAIIRRPETAKLGCGKGKA